MKKSFVQQQRYNKSKAKTSPRVERRQDERDEKAARRAAFNALPEHKKAEIIKNSEMVNRIMQNGITLDDLKDNFDKGYNAGFKDAGEPIIKTCYAAICLALRELYGFGRKRCMKVLNKVDQQILYNLASDETISEVWDKIGLQIDFKEILDERITEGATTK